MDAIQCRVCLESESEGFELVSLEAPFYDDAAQVKATIAEAINFYVSSVTCSSDDGLPYLICDGCIEELAQTSRFIDKVRESDAILRADQMERNWMKIVREEIEENRKRTGTDPESLLETEDIIVYEEQEVITEPEEFLVTEEIIYTDGALPLDDSYEIIDAVESTEDQENMVDVVVETIVEEQCDLEDDRESPEQQILETDGEKMHKCTECGKEFKRRDYLSNHIRFVHKKARPYLCSMCPNVYANSLRLKEHFRVHSGERPFKCEFCDMSFARNTTMIRHKLVHTGELPFQCKVCKKRFRQDATLRGHMFIHTGIGVPCGVCNKMFARKVDVKKHMVIHTRNLG